MSDKYKESEIQGEGDYKAARRYRRKVKQFVQTNDTEHLARQAAPHNNAEQQEMDEAESKGLARAKGRKVEKSNGER